MYCLGVFENEKPGGTLIGGISVRDILVVYDRRNQRVGLASTPCDGLPAMIASVAGTNSSGIFASAAAAAAMTTGTMAAAAATAGVVPTAKAGMGPNQGATSTGKGKGRPGSGGAGSGGAGPDGAGAGKAPTGAGHQTHKGSSGQPAGSAVPATAAHAADTHIAQAAETVSTDGAVMADPGAEHGGPRPPQSPLAPGAHAPPRIGLAVPPGGRLNEERAEGVQEEVSGGLQVCNGG